MNKTKIEWTDYSWNPIKGLCPTGCWYCYARRMYKRFGWNPEVRFELDDFNACVELYHQNIPDGSKIFVCSTIELFHPLIKKRWRDDIFSIIELNQKLTFQILTKFPQNIDKEMPDNVWLGVTFTGDTDMYNAIKIKDVKAKIKFASFEPMLYFPGRGILAKKSLPFLEHINWIILGRLAGHGKKYDPKKSWIDLIIKEAKKANIPVFLKDNLKEIWGGNLIQEFPSSE